MTSSPGEALERILKLCAQAAPAPWYPSDFVQAEGVSRDSLDPHLDRLRLAGAIELTDWVKGRGQGYRLTPAGEHIVQDRRAMASLRSGTIDVPAVPELDPAEQIHINGFERSDAVLDAVSHGITPLITFLLIAANVIVFLWGLSRATQQGISARAYLGFENQGPVVELLHNMGAMRASDLIKGEYWRLIACMFLHFGMLHLGCNMFFGLLMVGPTAERMWGRWGYLWLYFVSGFGGSCAMSLTAGEVLGAGASGAIWGVMASVAAWIVLNRSYLPGPQVKAWLQRFFTFFVLNAFVSFLPGISAGAHFGGGAVGVLASIVLIEQRWGTGLRKALGVAGLVLLPAACFVLFLVIRSFTPGWQQSELGHKHFPKAQAAEARANEILTTRINPLLFGRLGGLTAEEVKSVRQAFREVFQDLHEALAIFRSAGPYRDLEAERERQRAVKHFEDKIEKYEHEEFDRVLRPYVQSTLGQAIRTYRKYAGTIRKQEMNVDAADRIQAELAKVIDAEQILGPVIQHSDIEKERKRLSDHVEIVKRLLELAGKGLSAGATWTELERKELTTLESRLDEI